VNTNSRGIGGLDPSSNLSDSRIVRITNADGVRRVILKQRWGYSRSINGSVCCYRRRWIRASCDRIQHGFVTGLVGAEERLTDQVLTGRIKLGWEGGSNGIAFRNVKGTLNSLTRRSSQNTQIILIEGGVGGGSCEPPQRGNLWGEHECPEGIH
jgi:hypothetical protein